MIIGERLRALREERKLSHGDIEERTGMLRCYVSRVERGHTVPAVETLEKFARALEIPLYKIFTDGELPEFSRRHLPAQSSRSRKETRFFSKFRPLFARMKEGDRALLMDLAREMAVVAVRKARKKARATESLQKRRASSESVAEQEVERGVERGPESQDEPTG
jgi:transcriptional regulator with XRE-family HTH domain